MRFGIKMKLKRRNLEKRKEKSRDAARTRRSRETEIFLSLSQEIPISFTILSQMDKASVIRLAITHLKIRNFCDWVLERKKAVHTFTSVELESRLNKLYYKALNGFIMVLNNTGNLIFITDNILHHLGMSQVDLMGHSIFDFVHPCDHSELRDICGINKTDDKKQISFFLRMKCIRPCKGRLLSLKTNAYKVIHCSGFFIPSANYGPLVKYSQEDKSFIVVECNSILHPSNHNIKMDDRSFISHHTMDMKFIYCDDGISSLLGYFPEHLIGTCFYEFHHALDDFAITCAYKTLFSKGQSVTGLYRFLARNGGYAWVETQASLVKNPQTDKPQSVICINSVVTDILCKDETFGLIQHSVIKFSNDLQNVHINQRNHCFQKAKHEKCLYDDFVVSEISLSNDYLNDSHNSNIYNDLKCDDDKPKVVEFNERILHDKSDGVMFSTERILNSAKTINNEKAVGLMENDIQSYLESPSDCDANLHTDLSNISSSASLFKLLKEFDDDGDEMRAPFIPMDDLIFINNTSDPSLISAEEYDIPIFDTEYVGFSDLSKEIPDGIISSNQVIDYETSIMSHSTIINRDANKLKEEKQEEEDIGNKSSSVLMNLLVKGEDISYGYRLMTSNQNMMHEKMNSEGSMSKDSTLYQLLCS